MEEKFKVGNFLATLRKEKKLTQTEVASILNITEKAVSKWENGRCLPENKHLKQLSKLYNVRIDEIICGEKQEQNSNDKALLKVMEVNKAQHKAMKSIFIIFTTFIILNAVLTTILGNLFTELSVYTCFCVIIACVSIIVKSGINLSENQNRTQKKYFIVI